MHALARAEQVLIGITNPDHRSLQKEAASAHRHRREANPFSYFERREMIVASLSAADVDSQRYCVVPFPLDVPSCWADYVPLDALQLVRVFSPWEEEKARQLKEAGYAVETLAGNRERKISASDIRGAMRARQAWDHWVPDGARQMLARWDSAQLSERLRRDHLG